MAKVRHPRIALQLMLDHVFEHQIAAGGMIFVLSDAVLLKNPKVREALELCFCIRPLGRVYTMQEPLRQRLVHAAEARGISGPFLCMAWEVLETRYDEVNRQLLMDRPDLVLLERPTGGGRVEQPDQEDRPTAEVIWTSDPEL